MRSWVKLGLFFSSYTPLFIIFFVRNINFELVQRVIETYSLQEVGSRISLQSLSKIFMVPWFGYLMLILSMVPTLLLCVVIYRSKKLSGKRLIINKSEAKTSEQLNYIATYVIPFLSFQASSLADVLSVGILLTVMAIIYVNSNLVYINPILTLLFQYKLYKVEGASFSDVVVISKKQNLGKINAKVIEITSNVYLEVIDDGK